MKYRALYNTMYDDLKDAEMLIDYAIELKDDEKCIADELAKYALARYNHLLEFHQIFTREVQKEEGTDKACVMKCLWETTHEHYQEWAASIKNKIDKY